MSVAHPIPQMHVEMFKTKLETSVFFTRNEWRKVHSKRLKKSKIVTAINTRFACTYKMLAPYPMHVGWTALNATYAGSLKRRRYFWPCEGDLNCTPSLWLNTNKHNDLILAYFVLHLYFTCNFIVLTHPRFCWKRCCNLVTFWLGLFKIRILNFVI
jgi:hypothetical protein